MCTPSLPPCDPLRRRPPAPARSADGKSEAQRSDSHRHLELGFTAGLEGRQLWAPWGTIPLQVRALEGGRAPGKPGKGLFQHAGGPGAVGKGLPLGGNKPGAQACQPEPSPTPDTPVPRRNWPGAWRQPGSAIRRCNLGPSRVPLCQA